MYKFLQQKQTRPSSNIIQHERTSFPISLRADSLTIEMRSHMSANAKKRNRYVDEHIRHSYSDKTK